MNCSHAPPPRILGIGAVVVDSLYLLDAWPRPDTKVPARSRVQQAGGPVPTALRALANFGCRAVLASRIGNDTYGRFIQETLAESGVDLKHLLVSPGDKSGTASVWIDAAAQTRTLVFSEGSLGAFDYEAFDFGSFEGIQHLHIDGREPACAAKAARVCREQGISVSIDTGSYRPPTVTLLELCDCVIMPRTFAASWLGDADSLLSLAERVFARLDGVRLFALTDGVRGSVYTDGTLWVEKPALSVPVIDSCGAGDVHAGSVIYGFLQHWSMEKIALFAPAAAAWKCMRLGNAVLPSFDDITSLCECT